MRICLLAQTLGYLEGGGHFWVYLNWALGFFRTGAEVTWLETVPLTQSPESFRERRVLLEQRLRAYGLPVRTAYVHEDGTDLAAEYEVKTTISELAMRHDLLVNFRYSLPDSLVKKFPWKALVDIDPGLLQYWVGTGCFALAHYDAYFSISEHIGKRNPDGQIIPDLGVPWHHTVPCVDTASWPVTPCVQEGAYTTITHWFAREYVTEEDGTFYDNTKKSAFEPFLGLPLLVSAPMELAIFHDAEDQEEWERLKELGWKVRHSREVSETPACYRAYIQGSRGEFSVSKPSCVRMQNGWISDRTLCFLASGKPVIVQDTGPLSFLKTTSKDKNGFFRFKDMAQAVAAVQECESDYAAYCAQARKLAQTVFDAKKVAEEFLDKVFA